MGELQTYLTTGIHPDDKLVGQVIPESPLGKLSKYPLRYSTGLQHFMAADTFDSSVARALTNATEYFSGFTGQFLNSAKRASKLGFETLELHAATAHIHLVQERYADAYSRWPIEKSWLSDKMVEKQLKEYEIADRIYVNSEYSRKSFVAQGIDESKLVRTHLQINPRFKPLEKERADETFRVIYVGSLSVVKGIPLLLEAFSRLDVEDSELVLMGGWATRPMRKYLDEWKAKEPRLTLLSGDPLSYLQKSDVYVHPSYQDGYGYAPMEAMYCGVPVIVTEDTGAKENVIEGENGFVVPTGSWDAILDRMIHVYKER